MKTAIVGLLLLSGCYGGLSDVELDSDAGEVDAGDVTDAGKILPCCTLPHNIWYCGAVCNTVDAGN